MPLGGGSGEGGLAARGYNGPAQPGGNYGGTNVVGTGGGFLGDRSAINAAVLAGKPPGYNPNSSTPYAGVKPSMYQIVNGKKVWATVDPITGRETFQPISSVVSPAPFPGDNWQWTPQPGWQPGTGYPGRPDVIGGISNPRPGSLGGLGSGTGPGGPFGGFDTPQGDQRGDDFDTDVEAGGGFDSGAMRMMAAPGEQPLVSPGPMGPGGRPLGNGFRIGAPLMLRHAYNWPMQRPMPQPMQRPRLRMPPGGGRRDQRAAHLLRMALSRGRAG